MSDITVKYRNQTILETSTSGTRYLKTSGKVCDDDITIRYQRPTAEPPDASKIVYDVMDEASVITNGFLYTGEIYIWTSKNGVALHPDFTQPFEIGIVFKINNLRSYGFEGLFGAVCLKYSVGYYHDLPIAEISHGNPGDIWAGFSTDGSTYASELTLPSGSVQINTWYHFRYIWDGSVFKIGLSSDFENYIEASTQQTQPHYNAGSRVLLFGISGDDYTWPKHRISDGVVNLQGTYIKVNDTLVWGCTYCEDEKTFDYL